MTDIVRPGSVAGSGVPDLFQLLRDGRPRTRVELAELTGLARSTIGLRLDALTELGLVGPTSDGISTGGRPPSRFALIPDARLALGIDVGATHVQVAVTDLVGTELDIEQVHSDVADGPDAVLERALACADSVLQRTGRTRDQVIGVGVGLPGPVDFSTGRPVRPPTMPGWDDFDVPGWFRRHLNAPVLVDNDVNIATLGEHARLWRDREDFLFVKVATGIGAGVISSGRMQRGAQGIAGHIGHIQIERGIGTFCRCGNEGCLEAVASATAIAAALRREGIDAPDGGAVLDLVRAGDVRAIRAVRQAGRDLGEVLATGVSFLNPSVIVLGGHMAGAGEHLIAGVREVLYARAMPLSTQQLTIAASALGNRAAVVGAGLLAIQHALSPEGLESLAR